MQDFNDKIIYKTHQHKIILVMWIIWWFLPIASIWLVVLYFTTKNYLYISLFLIVTFIFVFLYKLFFWKTSYFLITNRKIVIRARNGIFSRFNMALYYENIRDIAYSKNNILHYFLNYGTFFARSSAGAWNWDFEASYIPNIAEVYKIVNNFYIMTPEQRNQVNEEKQWQEEKLQQKKTENKGLTKKEILEKQKKILLDVRWIKELVELDDSDRRYIFEHEEDRNHWVYETIKKQVVFCVTHDSNLRDPDSAIVLKLWNKVVFPAVNFHELNLPSTVSSSPWLEVHNYLAKKFSAIEEYDATILIGFDLE